MSRRERFSNGQHTKREAEREGNKKLRRAARRALLEGDSSSEQNLNPSDTIAEAFKLTVIPPEQPTI